MIQVEYMSEDKLQKIAKKIFNAIVKLIGRGGDLILRDLMQQ